MSWHWLYRHRVEPDSCVFITKVMKYPLFPNDGTLRGLHILECIISKVYIELLVIFAPKNSLFFLILKQTSRVIIIAFNFGIPCTKFLDFNLHNLLEFRCSCLVCQSHYGSLMLAIRTFFVV